MAIQWPLVLFSLLAGAGGALLAFAGLSELLGDARMVRRRACWAALGLLVVGGLISVAHLASPLHAISAVTNLLSFSSISIELMLLGGNVVVGVAYLALTREGDGAASARALAALAVLFGIAIGFFCGHGYVMDAQPTWNTEALPLAYLGTSLALGAFAYELIAALPRRAVDGASVTGASDELGGRLQLAVLACCALDAVGIVAYGFFLGPDAAGAHGILFWGGAVAIGIVGVLACGIAGMSKIASKMLVPLAAAGMACSFVGGIALRMLMWAVATGYLDLFSHGIPGVMLNL